MRKILFQRRGVSTMIGGIVTLALLLTALVATVLVTQTYDSYESLAAKMQRANNDRFSEQLRAVFPGIVSASGACPSGLSCNVMTINNQGIGTNIARIYINSTGGGCISPCILDPSSTPAAFTFRASDGYLNSGEFLHQVLFWMPNTFTLPSSCKIAGYSLTYGCNSIVIITSRGRTFAFQWPFPVAGQGGKGGAGGTGIYIGPVVYTFQPPLITYTTSSVRDPPIPISPPPYWSLPVGDPLIIYVKLQTDNGTKNDVYLTTQSVIELALFDSPGVTKYLYIIAPITLNLCYYFQSKDPTIVCNPNYGYYAQGNTGDPDHIKPYLPCAQPANSYNNITCSQYPRYLLPKPNATQVAQQQRGDPVVVAFGINSVCTGLGNCPNPQGEVPNAYRVSIQPAWAGRSVTTFLGLTYAYDPTGNGSNAYFFGVTLPFVAACMRSSTTTCQG